MFTVTYAKTRGSGHGERSGCFVGTFERLNCIQRQLQSRCDCRGLIWGCLTSGKPSRYNLRGAERGGKSRERNDEAKDKATFHWVER